jgi:hypothetical protein
VPAPKQPSAASSPRPARIYPPAAARTMSSATSSAVPSPTGQPVHHAPHQNAVAAFIIGLAIVTLASVLNAAGLNLTKLDHVRVLYVRAGGRAPTLCRSGRARYPRRRGARTGCARCGCSACSYTCRCSHLNQVVKTSDKTPCSSLSQLIGSTLALEYLRAGGRPPLQPPMYAPR